MNTKIYRVGLAGRMSRTAWVRVQAPNKVEAKKAAKRAVPAESLGGSVVYTSVSVYPESDFPWDFAEATASNPQPHLRRYVDLTA